MKYVLVTGGVVSGLGKGVTASSIGVLLKACGKRVTSIKIGAPPAPAPPTLPTSLGHFLPCRRPSNSDAACTQMLRRCNQTIHRSLVPSAQTRT